MTPEGYYVPLRKNGELKVNAYVTAYDKTGVNYRKTANGELKGTFKYLQSLKVEEYQGEWAKVSCSQGSGWVWLNICRG